MRAKFWIREVKKWINTWVQYPERAYLVIALLGVIGFAFITPPFQGPDEKSHYIRMQYVAHGYFLSADAKEVGASLPKSIQDVMNSTELKDSGSGGGLKKYDLRNSSAVQTPLDSDKSYQPPMISYTAIPYLPAVPGVAAANAFNVSALASMYIGRLSLGIFCVLITFFSLRLLPNKKYFFMGIALIPMLLFQQAVISTDGVSYALLLSFICFVLYLHQKKSISRKQWIIVGLFSVGITLAKPLVFLFLPFILLLVEKKRAFRWIAGIAILCIILFGSLTFYNSHLSEGVVDPNVPQTVDSGAQLTNVTENPKRFLRVMWNSYMTSHGDEEIQGIFGIFGSADTIYPLWMIIGYIITLTSLATVKLERDNEARIPARLKGVLIGLSILYFMLVNFAIYLSFTPLNFDIVYGVQGRYFLPILILLPILITPFLTVETKTRQRFIRYNYCAIAVFILMALFITVQRYYLYTP